MSWRVSMNKASILGSLKTSEGCFTVSNLKLRCAEAALAPETVPTDCRRTPLMDLRMGKITLVAKLPAPMQPTRTSRSRRGRVAATVGTLFFDRVDALGYSKIAVYSPCFRSA